MTILSALVGYYDRLAASGQAPEPGHAPQRIAAELVLAPDGTPLRLAELGTPGEKKPGRIESVPVVERTSGIQPAFLWDKTAYSLGVIAEKADDGSVGPGQGKRTEKEHAAFRVLHEEILAGTEDPGLLALIGFLGRWQPGDYAGLGFDPALLDGNIVFRLDGDSRFLHQRPAARAILQQQSVSEGERTLCLVTGNRGAPARLHPSIKGVAGAQTSGASLVSFNLDAFDSHGKSQGANAPVSESAAFAYGTALNALLARGSDQKTRIGDATVVFWAEGKGRSDMAAMIDDLMAASLSPPLGESDEDAQGKLRATLEKIARGQASGAGDPGLDPTTTVHLLGLAPNNARLAVRFWHSGAFGDFARRMVEHFRDLDIAPAAWKGEPAAWALLYETAVQRKAENIPPMLGGALMRSVLNGTEYPMPLLAAVISRLRAGDPINGPRAAICKACLARKARFDAIRGGMPPEDWEDRLVSLDRSSTSTAYRLGRLFAVLESAQRAALGKVNATIRDRYFASASATPASVFPVLMRNSTHHLAGLRKGEKGGLGVWLEKEIAEIVDGLDPDLPRNLKIEDQGRFVIGYYHQRYSRRDDKPEEISKQDNTVPTVPEEETEE